MNSHRPPVPSLSVVLVAASGAASVARTLWHLRQQSARRAIEVIVVAERGEVFDGIDLHQADFCAIRVLPVGAITQRGEAAARGIKASTAPIVGLIEDHSFPEPEWADALIRAHDGPWAGVGPVVENANPASTLSCVNFVLTYGAFSGSQPAGPRDLLPWHNSAYKRDVLREFEPRLGDLLAWEGALQAELRRRGHTLYLEPAARTHHANVSRFISSMGLNLQRGRMLGAMRADRECWPRWRRLVHASLFPLYPWMQLRYVLPGLARQNISHTMRARVWCMLVPALYAMAVGEARGILGGAGDALHRLEDFELHRLTHVSRQEREQIIAFADALERGDPVLPPPA